MGNPGADRPQLFAAASSTDFAPLVHWAPAGKVSQREALYANPVLVTAPPGPLQLRQSLGEVGWQWTSDVKVSVSDLCGLLQKGFESRFLQVSLLPVSLCYAHRIEANWNTENGAWLSGLGATFPETSNLGISWPAHVRIYRSAHATSRTSQSSSAEGWTSRPTRAA